MSQTGSTMRKPREPFSSQGAIVRTLKNTILKEFPQRCSSNFFPPLLKSPRILARITTCGIVLFLFFLGPMVSPNPNCFFFYSPFFCKAQPSICDSHKLPSPTLMQLPCCPSAYYHSPQVLSILSVLMKQSAAADVRR